MEASTDEDSFAAKEVSITATIAIEEAFIHEEEVHLSLATDPFKVVTAATKEEA